ncbi:replication-associated recombination protein A [bacterium]|nr:replication-associated recombination protein A [bacterium]
MTDTSNTLFPDKKAKPPRAPLAERMRPQSLDTFLGQEHLLGEGAVLRGLIDAKELPSLIFWGDPGTGKTTLARILARNLNYEMVSISAISTGVPELRKILAKAQQRHAKGLRTLLFVDEIHRWSKSQQDALLHAVEEGTVTLLGATTENPSFEVISPLLSRARVLRFHPLNAEHLKQLLYRAMREDEFLKKSDIQLTADAEETMLSLSGGDARVLYNALELAVNIAPRDGKLVLIEKSLIEKSVLKRLPIYDKKGDAHYDTISAFIKSVRASDPDAAVYYLARMLDAGEDPLFIARRMVVLASEDIGNANPNGLVLATSCFQAVHQIGMPEARIVLAQTCCYLASSPKSNASYMAIEEASAVVKNEQTPAPVPLHMRNPVTGLMKSEGYGKGYVYPHDRPGHFAETQSLPDTHKDKIFYHPTDQGQEQKITERLRNWWKKRR